MSGGGGGSLVRECFSGFALSMAVLIPVFGCLDHMWHKQYLAQKEQWRIADTKLKKEIRERRDSKHL